MLKKAIFVNTEYVIDIPHLMERLEQYKETYDVFVSDRSNFKLRSLCTGVDASFLDYDYVVCINPTEKEIHDVPRNYAAKQNYHISGLLNNPERTDRIIEQMEQNPFWGMAMLPVDFLTASNWVQYENWADYYKIIIKWLRNNEIKVPTDNDKPPICATGGCSIIRTEAIKGLEKIVFKMFGPFFIALILSLVCQHNGYLPQYVITKDMLVNNCFGYETYTSWMPDVLKVKKEYYKQLEKYNKETEEYYENLNEQMEQLRGNFIANYEELQRLYQLNDVLQEECKTLRAENKRLRDSISEKNDRFFLNIFKYK